MTRHVDETIRSTFEDVDANANVRNVREPDADIIPKHRRRGMHCRFSRIHGETPRGVLHTPLWLPALLGPLSDTQDYSQGFTDYTTVSAGQFTTPPAGDRNARFLRTVENLGSLVLWWDAPWLIEHGQNHNSVERALYRIQESKRPVEMLLTLSLKHKAIPHLRMDVTLRTITRELREGEPDTHYLTLGISEWRDPSVERRGRGEGRKAGVRLPTTKRLLNTDTMASLSMEFYGSYKHWRWIRDANGLSHKFGAHTIIVYNTRFQTGQKIKIPDWPTHDETHHRGRRKKG